MFTALHCNNKKVGVNYDILSMCFSLLTILPFGIMRSVRSQCTRCILMLMMVCVCVFWGCRTQLLLRRQEQRRRKSSWRGRPLTTVTMEISTSGIGTNFTWVRVPAFIDQSGSESRMEASKYCRCWCSFTQDLSSCVQCQHCSGLHHILGSDEQQYSEAGQLWKLCSCCECSQTGPLSQRGHNGGRLLGIPVC